MFTSSPQTIKSGYGLGVNQMAKRRCTFESQNILRMSLWWYRWCCAKGYRPRD